MTEERAINLYYFMVQNKAPKRELDVVLDLLKQQYQIDLSRMERKRQRPQNRFDINSYGAGGSRTMNQTRQLGG